LRGKEKELDTLLKRVLASTGSEPEPAVSLLETGKIFKCFLGQMAKLEKSADKVDRENKEKITSLKVSLAEKESSLVEANAKLAVLESKQVESLKVQLDTKKVIEENKASALARSYALEKKNVAANLVVKNLKMTSDSETKEETKSIVANLLAELKVDGEVFVVDAYRFKKPENAPVGFCPIVLIKLAEPVMKTHIFQNLGNLSKSVNFRSCSINNEVPASVRKPVAYKEQIAYRFRQRFAGSRTKIEIYQGLPVETNTDILFAPFFGKYKIN
jgi:hypothetical protein